MVRLSAIHRKLLRDFLHLRGQVVAIAAVVACGIATFVTMRSTIDSLETSRDIYYSENRFAEVFAQVRSAPNHLIERLREIPGVMQVEARIVKDVTVDVPGLEEPATARLVSVPDHGRPLLNDVTIQQGRYIALGHHDEIVISESFAKANEIELGQQLTAVLNGRSQAFTIVGIGLSPEYVYEVREMGMSFPDNKRFGVMWVSRQALESSFNLTGAFNDLSLVMSRGAQEEDVILRLDKLLKPYGGFGAFGRRDQVSARFLADEIRQNRATANIMPMIFLGVAAFLLHIVMTRLISTQRDQVAVLKAFGYSNTAIALHYFELAMLSVGVGAVVGVAAGLYFGGLLTDVYALFYHFPFRFYEASASVILTSVAITAAAAAVGALSAVRFAVSLPPAEAMRPESPPEFREGILERMHIGATLTPTAKMIYRSIERRPIKAILSILAIGFAGAILILSRYTADAIDYVIDLYFYKTQREDVMLVFQSPASTEAKHALRQLPGITYQEGFRMLAVQLHHGHHSRRLAITGLESDASLRLLIDMDRKVFPIPERGLTLTTKLGEMLHARVGDTLEVEILEGAQRTVDMPVVALVDEMIGISAYTSLSELNRIAGDPPLISGVYASVDPLAQSALNRELKTLPRVAAASFREVTIKSFEDTIEQNMSINNVVLTLFAIIIALGVIYNGARISLSERGRELASLRVLGFTKGEVSLMLLGEQAILLVLGIPAGLGLGYWIASMLPAAFESELMRFPFYLSAGTYAYMILMVIVSGILSAILIRRRIYRLDLISVLKTRE